MGRRTEKPASPLYAVFYVLFSTETWRIVLGFLLSIVFTPHILPGDLSAGGRAIVYVMVATIGYSATGHPARWITNALKKAILGDKRPGS